MPDEKTTKAPETAAPDTGPGKAPEQAPPKEPVKAEAVTPKEKPPEQTADKTAGAEKKDAPPVEKTGADKVAGDGGKAAPPVEKAGTEKDPAGTAGQTADRRKEPLTLKAKNSKRRRKKQTGPGKSSIPPVKNWIRRRPDRRQRSLPDLQGKPSGEPEPKHGSMSTTKSIRWSRKMWAWRERTNRSLQPREQPGG